jgi:hypothetical protein
LRRLAAPLQTGGECLAPPPELAAPGFLSPRSFPMK